jgi:cyclic-di-AMP phosphodiesterase PgpH
MEYTPPRNRFDLGPLLRRLNIPQGVVGKAALATGLLILLALMYPHGESIDLDYRVGGVWSQKDLIAPFSFPVFRDEKEYAGEVAAARKSVYQVFEQDTLVQGKQLRLLREFFATPVANSQIPLTPDQWALLKQLASRGDADPMRSILERTLRYAYATGVLDRSKGTITPQEIALRSGNTEVLTPAVRLFDHNDVATLLESRLQSAYRSDSARFEVAYRIGLAFLLPDIRFSAHATEAALTSAIDAVPRTVGFVQENERIVSKHERITLDTKLRLESLRRAKAERGPAPDSVTHLIGASLHVAVVVVLYAFYLGFFRRRIFTNNRKLALIALLLLLEAFFAYLSRELDVQTPVEYLIFVPTASMLLTIIFDSRVGFYGTVIIAFVVAGIRGSDYSIALASLVAGALSVYSVRDMKNRTQLFRSLGFIFCGYAVVIVSLGLERFEPIQTVIVQLVFALINAIVSPVLTYGLLIFLERTFRVTTDLSLMELARFNHPLLRMLAEKAPGTYHHSITMATLAESAAAAIGANEVLARVGAYFHDVGKVVKPTYFVENQKGSRNRHDKLAPRMSSLIIAAHVKEGITLARSHGLPEEVVDFIPMHHGTTRIDYFYNKALALAQNSDDETKIDEINEGDYRYPGPRPQTRETGIMMLADAIEAAVRTIDDPTPQRLSDAVDELVKKRLDDGELDECPLTLSDLTKIKAAFLGVLVGVYHTRVRYPDPPKERIRKPRVKPAIPEPDQIAGREDGLRAEGTQ